MNDFTVMPMFTCKLEKVDREKFQSEGHFVSGSYKEDKLRPRPLIGSEVYNLTLHHPQIADPDEGDHESGKQILRFQGGSEAAVADLMQTGIWNHFMALQRAEWMRQFDYEQFRVLNEERARLATFLAYHYGEEVRPGETDMGTICQVAIRHLREDRGRLSVRLSDWLRRLFGRPRQTGWNKPNKDMDQRQ